MTKQTVNNEQASELLLKMIKEEMAHTILHAKDMSDHSDQDELVQGNGESNAQLLGLADALLNNMDSDQGHDQLKSALFARLHKSPHHFSKSLSEDHTSATALGSMESTEDCSSCSSNDNEEEDDDGLCWIHDSSYNDTDEDTKTHVTDSALRGDEPSIDALEDVDSSDRSPTTRTNQSSIHDLLTQFAEIAGFSDEEELNLHECAENEPTDWDEMEDFDDEFSCISDVTGFKAHVPPPPSSLRAPGAPRRKIVMIDLDVVKSPTGVADLRKRIEKPQWVRFDKVQVRYHKMIVNDNPGNTGGGPSLGLGWHYHPVLLERSVDDFEKARAKKRRSGRDLAWDRMQREAIAKQLGCSRKEIVEMVRAINKTKMQRRQTVNNLGAEKMEAAVENVSRKFKKLFTIKRS